MFVRGDALARPLLRTGDVRMGNEADGDCNASGEPTARDLIWGGGDAFVGMEASLRIVLGDGEEVRDTARKGDALGRLPP